MLATLRRMHTPRGWLAVALCAFVGLLLIPLLHGALDHRQHRGPDRRVEPAVLGDVIRGQFDDRGVARHDKPVRAA